MADETCVEVNCCPLGYSVPLVNGTLSLAGDDTTGTDPRIASGDFIFAEEAKFVRAILVSGNQNVTVNSASDLQVGFGVECIGVYKTITINAASATVVVSNTNGLKIGQLLDTAEETITAGNFVVGNAYKIKSVGTTNFIALGAASNTIGTVFTATGVGSGTGTANNLSTINYFPYGTVISNIVGSTVTLSNPAFGSTTTEVLFRPFSPPLIVGANVVVPSTLYPSFSPLTRITNIAGTTLTLSAAPTAPMTNALLAIFPVDLNPNVFDEAELFT